MDPAPASAILQCSPLCVFLSKFHLLIGTPVTGFRVPPTPGRPHLNLVTLQRPHFQIWSHLEVTGGREFLWNTIQPSEGGHGRDPKLGFPASVAFHVLRDQGPRGPAGRTPGTLSSEACSGPCRSVSLRQKFLTRCRRGWESRCKALPGSACGEAATLGVGTEHQVSSPARRECPAPAWGPRCWPSAPHNPPPSSPATLREPTGLCLLTVPGGRKQDAT